MDADHAGETPTVDSGEDTDNVSICTSTSSLFGDKIDTSDKNVTDANPATTLNPVAER